MRRPFALIAIPALVLLAALLLPAGLGAHSGVADTRPAEGAVLASPPERVVVSFASPIARVAPARVTVDGSGDVAGETRIDPGGARRVLIAVDPAAPGGAYRATWSVTALDGHVEEGEVAFEVRGGDSTAGARLAGAAAFVQARGR
ncbi:MAG: copper resistance protein CopC [Miltoncostaeaceae bacterium]